MSEETLVRELERRAGDVQPRHLRFEDVRASAHRIRRRRRVTASGIAAAVVAAVLLVPGLMGGSSPSHRPEPAPPAPTITPGQTVPFDLDAPLGDAPHVLYQRLADDVAIDADGEHDLPAGTMQVAAFDGGYLAIAQTPGDRPHTVDTRLHRLDSDYAQVEDLGPTMPMMAVSPDGTRAAYTLVADRTGTLVVDDGTDAHQVTLPAGQVARPYGLTAAGAIYHLQTRTEDLGFWELGADGEQSEVAGLIHVYDASPVTGLVAGVGRFDSKLSRPCGAVVSGGQQLWQQCGLELEDLSPDGRLVIGYPEEGTPFFPVLTVVDAETGHELVRFDGGGQGQVVETAWEDDAHVLAVVEQDGREAVLRLGLDGTVERTTDFEESHELATSWFLAGRPHE